ncbi:MAG: DUF2252 domain-containing protein [Solirubrobacteraceae bacterium]
MKRSAVAASTGSALHQPRVPVRERRAEGRAARERLKRGALGRWQRPEGFDPLALLSAQNSIRVDELLPIRYERMASSPWAFYRGAAALMAADLSSGADTGLRVQLCGDAHILNFGLWATPERQLAFDLRDFDETLPGPFEWDVLRLAASIVVLARDAGVQAGEAERAVSLCLRAYRDRMAGYVSAGVLDIWYDLITVDDLVEVFEPADQELAWSHITRKARKRTSAGAARKLTTASGGRLRITEDPPLRVHLDDGGPGLADEVFEAYRASLPAYRRYLLDSFSFVDAARQVVGVGSVGMRVFLVLLEGRGRRDLVFLQIKQAGSSVYEPACGASRYANHGQRVVVGKRVIQAATDIFAGWTTVGDHDFYVRQLRDMKVIPSGELIAPRLGEFATACGRVLARAHARTGDPIAIAAYIGKGRAFDDAVGEFAVNYADQTAADHRRLAEAVAAGHTV